MTMLTPQQIADLKASIAKRFNVQQIEENGQFCVCYLDGYAVSDNDHVNPADAEAEMEAIIQDEVKAAMEAIDE